MISGVPVVAAPAAIDITARGELRRIFRDSAAAGHATVVVDLTRTWSCPAAGLSVLVGAHRRALFEGGGLRLAITADGPLECDLDLTGVGRFIPTFMNVAEALAAGADAVIVPFRPRTSPGLLDPAQLPSRPAEGA
jgi:anti-anti-sigma regulatory factor